MEFPKEAVETSIPARFEKVVQTYPELLALKMGNRSFTYGELNRYANRIARAIIDKRGYGSEPIALLFDHGLDAIAAILGVLKAAKFYVLLDPKYPPNRARYILHDSRATLLVTNNQGAMEAPESRNYSLPLLNVDDLDSAAPDHNLSLKISPDAIENVSYTSGSEGLPKGVKQLHRVSLYSTWTIAQRRPSGIEDRLSLVHSLVFESAKLQLGQALLSGAALFPFDVQRDGVVQMAKWLEEEQITILHLPPSLFRELAECLPESGRLRSLRLLYLSGTPITKLDFELYKKHFPAQTMMGCHMATTETRATCAAIIDKNFNFPERGTIAGYAFPDKKILLLDSDGRRVEAGQVGQIAIQSRYLNSGYLNQPALTEAKFLTHPEDMDERIYLTGDLGRMRPDGFLIHLGRMDRMVKIRGYRVELDEIERRLNEFPGIKIAAVEALERNDGEKFLAAYVVARDGTRPKVDRVRSFLGETLPPFMIPAVFVVLDSLPLTNGKVDRKSLPKPEDVRPELTTQYAAPRNEMEKILVGIWEDVLNVRPVGIHDNFFDLGGNSLNATRVVSRVIKQSQLEIPLQALLQSPTVAEMAAVVGKHQRNMLDNRELATILDELDSLSDDEASRRTGENYQRDFKN